MIFRNEATGEELSHSEYVRYIWEETKKNFQESHPNEEWSNLTFDEQIDMYCNQIEENDWTFIDTSKDIER